MTGGDIQGWSTLAITVVLFLRTFIGDGKKAFAHHEAELVKLRADLSDFQLKVATEYARHEQISPRLDRIENMLMQALGIGRPHGG